MTLLPHDNQDVKGLSGPQFPKYKVGPVCCIDGCSHFADHSHHLWRRSFLGGDFSWVELWDHTIVGNLVPLCWKHHELVTQGKLWMRWENDEIVCAPPELKYGLAIYPQPPRHGVSVVENRSDSPLGPASRPVCPGCHRPLPHPKDETDKREKSRRRKTWTVTVPDDGEDGALVLDTLLEECRALFAHDESVNTRYFSLVQALALVVQNGHLLSK